MAGQFGTLQQRPSSGGQQISGFCAVGHMKLWQG